MEIIIITTHMTNGGAQRVLSVLIEEWRKKGNLVTIIQTKPTDFSSSYNYSNDINIVNLGRYRSKLLSKISNVVSLLRYLKKHPHAVVIAFLNSCISLAAICSLFVSNVFVFSERNDPARYPTKRIKRKIRDVLFKCADLCVFQTNESKSHFADSIQKKGVIIPNPINNNLPKINRKSNSNLIVAIGRLSKQKNFPMLIYAFKKIRDIFPEFELNIYGNDEGEMNKLLQLVEELKLKDAVHFNGFANDVFNILNNCAMYVSSSDYEGISNSMLEALAMGVPSICTDCPAGGAREMICNGENGILIPVGDVDALFKSMKQLIENQDFSDKLSRNAAKIRCKYPAEKVAQLWIDAIENAKKNGK